MAYLQRKGRVLLALIGLSFVLFPISAGQKPAELYFGGERLTLGMHVTDAAAAIVPCCVLSPPIAAADNGEGGHFVITKDGRFLGTIWFSAGRVSRISQSIDSDFDGYNADAVRLARALYRALAPTSGDSRATVQLSVQHQRMSNGEGDTLSLSFPNGRGIELQLIILDKPDRATNNRDAVTLYEVLEPSRP